MSTGRMPKPKIKSCQLFMRPGTKGFLGYAVVDVNDDPIVFIAENEEGRFVHFTHDQIHAHKMPDDQPKSKSEWDMLRKS